MEDIPNTKRLASIIKNVRVAMMHTHRAGDGFAGSRSHIRPMYTQRLDEDHFDGELFFFTDSTSRKVHDLQDDQQIVLTYSDNDKNQYAVVYGTARCEHNEQKVAELWNIHAKGWWPEGPQSPNLTLIRVQVTAAEYWDGPSNISYVIQLIQAVATGQRIEDYGKHGKIG